MYKFRDFSILRFPWNLKTEFAYSSAVSKSTIMLQYQGEKGAYGVASYGGTEIADINLKSS